MRRFLFILLALALLADLPVSASPVEHPLGMQVVTVDVSGGCGIAVDSTSLCKIACSSGSAVAAGCLKLPAPEHASAFIPGLVRAPSSFARAPDTTPPKRSIV